ncbi:MAG TPA: hypothetical protein VHD15_04670 [Hyphomicrobiales bacterium]|nr:hypothetical protein [Hyphomicrobiales bacterium]
MPEQSEGKSSIRCGRLPNVALVRGSAGGLASAFAKWMPPELTAETNTSGVGGWPDMALMLDIAA